MDSPLPFGPSHYYPTLDMSSDRDSSEYCSFLWDQVVSIPHALSSHVCKKARCRFEVDSTKRMGTTLGGNKESTKKSMDLPLKPSMTAWEDIYKEFSRVLSLYVSPYLDRLASIIPTYSILDGYGERTLIDHGFQIQRTAPNQGYGWHHDGNIIIVPDATYYPTSDAAEVILGWERVFTYIFYLNDVEEGIGGRTQFRFRDKEGNYTIKSILPTEGTLLLFPANELFQHRGEELKRDIKYISTGWVSHLLVSSHGREEGYGSLIDHPEVLDLLGGVTFPPTSTLACLNI